MQRVHRLDKVNRTNLEDTFRIHELSDSSNDL